MSNVTQQTAWRLKQAGMPQPEPAENQVWYFDTGVQSEQYNDFPIIAVKKILAFAPDLDFITPYLPEGFILQMWDGRHSCKVETEDTTIRTQADSFAEAAALVYLELQKTRPIRPLSNRATLSET